MNVEKISAIKIKINDMARSVHFSNRLLGLNVLYGGENAYFSSLQTLGVKDTILNLEKGHVTPHLEADNFLCRRCRSVLGSYERKGI